MVLCRKRPLRRYASSWRMMVADKRTMATMFKLLRAQWPKHPFTKMTIEVYTRCLHDIPDEILIAATAHCLTTCTFFPVIAEIRWVAFDLMCNQTESLSASEAWGLLIKAAHKPVTWWAAGEQHHRPELPRLVRKALEAIGGWSRLVDSDNYSADRARFLEAYQVFAKKEREVAQMLPEVRELAKALAMDRMLEG